jgi:hypothetical protein
MNMRSLSFTVSPSAQCLRMQHPEVAVADQAVIRELFREQPRTAQ